LLARRLVRHGLAPSAGAVAALLAQEAASAAVPPPLLRSTVRAAAGQAVAAPVACVLEGVLRAILLDRLRKIAGVLLMVALLAAGTGLVLPASEPAADPPPLGRAQGADPPRDRHGDPLPEGAVGRLGAVRFRHGQWVRCVAFSPDGRRVVSCSADFTIRLWDRETGQEVRRFAGHNDQVQFVRFTPDGKHLISAGGGWHLNNQDSSIRLWDAERGKELRRLVEADGQHAKMAVDLTPDGKTLAFGIDTVIRLLSIPDGRHLGDIPLPLPPGQAQGPDSLARLVRFSPDGKRLAAIVHSAGACVFDMARRELLWQDRGQPTDILALASDSGLDFSPDGKLLAAAWAVRKPIRLFAADTGQAVRTFIGPVPGGGPLLFSADGRRLFSNGWGKEGLIWEAATGQMAGQLQPPPSMPFWFTRSPDGKTLALAGQRSIQLYDAVTGRQFPGPAGANGPVDHLEFLPDARTVLAGSYWDRESGARFWDLTSGRLVCALDRPAASVALAPDGKTFAAGFYHGRPVIADVATGKVLRTCQGPPLFLDSLAFTGDGRHLLGTGWTGKQLHAWDAATGAALPALGKLPQGGAKHLALSPDGSRLATAGMDQVVRLWDVPGRKQTGQLTGMRGPVMAVSWSPDGREVAAVSAEGHFSFGGGTPDPHVRIWDVASGKERLALAGPKDGSWCVAWSSDGQLLAAGGEDNVTRVWERATGEECFTLAGHAGPVTALAFTPDGKRLLSGSSDTTVLAWDVFALGKDQRPARAEDLPALWQALAGEARPADRAMRSLIAAPALTVGLLREHLRPAAALDRDRLARRIAELDSPQFATRGRVSRELEAMGDSAAEALRKALAGKVSLEARRRAEALLKRLTEGPLTGEPLRTVRATAVLEHIGTPAARNLLQTLAGGAPEARLTREARESLRRLARHAAAAGTR
jgi:WD40 repeat protein